MKQFLAVSLICLGLGIGKEASGQTVTSGSSFCSNHSNSLYCLLPVLYANAQPNPFTPLTAAFASQLTQVPLASPASGIIYTLNPALKIPERSGQETYGPVLTERGDTMGKNKIFVSATYQHFDFSSLDGISLKEIPVVFNYCNSTGQCAPISTINRVDLKVNQSAFFATYGLLEKLDLSVAIPINDVHMAGQGISCVVPLCNGPTDPSNTQVQFKPKKSANQANGIGDIVFRVKYRAISRGRTKVAVGGDFRLNSGDELNFLGAGTAGFKPFVAVSRGGLISPHLNVSYQRNGDSLLGGSEAGVKGKLPDSLSYALGIDAAINKRATVAFDFIGEHVYDQLRIKQTVTLGVPDIALGSGNFNAAKGAAGVKYNPFSNFLISVNTLWRMDHNGLRNKTVPLAGISYTF
jgi:hypothetical protein